MQRTPWFDRKFPPIQDNGLFPCILERLEGTPARLYHKLKDEKDNLATVVDEKWSIKKEIGHLLDLEPLWHNRSLQIIENEQFMQVADLTNRQTYEANHDDKSINSLIADFERARNNWLSVLRQIKDTDLEKSALHPRLMTPMRLIDLAFFVAEHDDHHLARITEIQV